MNERERVAMPETKKESKSSQIRKADFSQASHSAADRILFLQRNIGNKIVESMIRSH